MTLELHRDTFLNLKADGESVAMTYKLRVFPQESLSFETPALRVPQAGKTTACITVVAIPKPDV